MLRGQGLARSIHGRVVNLFLEEDAAGMISRDEGACCVIYDHKTDSDKYCENNR